MKQKIIITAVIISILLFSSIPGFGEELNLTLEEVIDLALNQSPEIIKLTKEFESAQKGIDAARANFYPKLDLFSNYTYLQEPSLNPLTGSEASEDSYTFKLDLKQPIYTGGRIRAAYDEAENNFTKTELELEKKKQDMVYQVTRQYYDILKAEEFVGVSQSTVERVRRYVKIAEANREVGIATNTDVLQAKIDYARAQQALLRAENNLELAALALQNTLGLTGEKLQLSNKLSWQEEGFSFDQIRDYALDHRNELRQLELEKDNLKLNLKKLKSSRLPNLSLSGNYNTQGDEFKVRDGDWQLGLTLTYNLFDGGGTEAEINKLQKEIEKLDISSNQLEDAIVLEIKQGLLELEEAKQRINLMELSLQQAEDNLAEMELKYREGLITSLDVLEAETAYKEVKTDYLQAIYDYNLAKTKLNKAIGRPAS